MAFDVAAVRARLAALPAPTFTAPLDEDAVRAFETAHRIELPADYRAYLGTIGNGGPGPDGGLWPLGVYDGRELEPYSAVFGDLAAPFPHREPWNLPAARLSPPDTFASEADELAWYQQLDADYHAPALLDGALYISGADGLRTLLVVTGPERGHLWLDARADDRGLLPLVDNAGRRLDFAAWYQRWLDTALAAT